MRLRHMLFWNTQETLGEKWRNELKVGANRVIDHKAFCLLMATVVSRHMNGSAPPRVTSLKLMFTDTIPTTRLLVGNQFCGMWPVPLSSGI
jgi:hypothetical protein